MLTAYSQQLFRFELEVLADYFSDHISPKRGALLRGDGQAIAKVPADLLELMRISGALLLALPEPSLRGFPSDLLEDPDPVNRWLRCVFALIDAYGHRNRPLRDFLSKKISPNLSRIANIARASCRALYLLAQLVEDPAMWVNSEATDNRIW